MLSQCLPEATLRILPISSIRVNLAEERLSSGSPFPSTDTSPATHEERRQPSHSLRGMTCFFFIFTRRGPPQMIPHQETLFHINETHSSQNFHEFTSLNTLGCPDSGSNHSSESAALDSLALGWVVCLMDSHPNVGEPIWASLMMPPPPRCLLFALESSQ